MNRSVHVLSLALALTIGLALGSVVTAARTANRLTASSVVTADKLIEDKWQFLKDTKSGGCWLVYLKSNLGAQVAIVEAPPTACE